MRISDWSSDVCSSDLKGMTLKDARIVYRTYGKLNADRSNAILYPTSYAAHHTDIEWLIGEGRVLDPERWFVVIPNMFGNGLSSSPSNTPFPYDCGRYPNVTTYTNAMAQRRLLPERKRKSVVARQGVSGR